MLYGEYHHQIDAKGRVRIPPKFKDAIGAGMITKGTNGCLFLFKREEFEAQIQSKIEKSDMFDTKMARPLRQLMSSAFELEEDNQGRSLLPKALREFAQVDKDIVFIGVGNRAELWAREVYDKYMEDVDFDKACEGLN